MPNYAVSTTISALNKFSGVFAKFGQSAKIMGDDSEKHFGRAGKAASLFGQIFTGTLASSIAMRGFDAIKNAFQQLPDFAERAEGIAKTAMTIGMTTDALQRLNYAATQTGTPVEAVQAAFKKMNVGMAEMTKGTGPLMKMMMRINPQLAVQLRNTKDSKQAFLLVAQAIKQCGNAQTDAAIAQTAFGRGGQELIPLLTQGSAGIEQLMQDASIYGDVLDNKTIAASDKFAEASKKLKSMVTSVKDEVMGFVVQAATPYVEKAVEWIAAHKELIATKIQDFIKGFSDLVGKAIPIVETIIDDLKKWSPILLGIVGGFVALKIAQEAASAISIAFGAAQAIMEAFQIVTQGAGTVWEALDVAMSANPIGLIIIAVGILSGAIYLMIKHWKEVTHWIGEAWDKISTFADGITKTILPAITALGDAFMKALLSPINLVIDGIAGLLSMIGKIPGIGKPFADAAAAVKGFQDKMNATLTGNTNQFGFGQVWTGAQAPTVNTKVPVTVNVDNARAPGVTSTVRVAPHPSGYVGPPQ
ncbi:MAG: hypothetical protein ABSF77_18645 [Spirochaetia bacterium]|jgi:hypothetical protein